MKEHKLNTRFLICLIVLAVVVALAIRVVYMGLTGQIHDETGEAMDKSTDVILSTLIALVTSTYLYSLITMLRQYIFCFGNAFELTERGIEHTMVYMNLFALIFVIPVKCIPWEAVKYVSLDNKGYKASVDTKMVKANFLVRFALRLGYGFCYKFTKQNITEEELRLYGVKIKASFLDD